MITMNALDYDAACSLVLESFEANGMNVARREAAELMGVELVHLISFRFMLESGRRMREEFLRRYGWRADDAGCWAEPGSNKYRWKTHEAEREQRRRLRGTPK